MKEQFEAILTGSDNPVDGIVSPVNLTEYIQAYEFKSMDGSLHLVIGFSTKGKWERVSGSEPYLSGWTDELVEQIAISKHHHPL
jgi:hypothetical protein